MSEVLLWCNDSNTYDTTHMFPQNIKKHHIETRIPEKFKVYQRYCLLLLNACIYCIKVSWLFLNNKNKNFGQNSKGF